MLGVENKTFLHSWNWGDFQEKMEHKIWRLGIYENDELAAVALLIKIEAKRGKFLFVPHGPIVTQARPVSADTGRACVGLVEKLKTVAKEEKCSFIRIAPVWERNEENAKFFKDLGFRKAPIHSHPELTWQMDLCLSEDELFVNMRKTTRYLIKQGLKNKDLKIIKSQEIKDIKIFDKMYKETSLRHHFTPFSQNYLKNEFLSFTKDGQAVIFLAKYRGKILAAAIIIFWQGIGFYHQGASSQKELKVPASYLLQWEAIKAAKNHGCKIYNFWGVADVESEEELKKHPWKGLSLFKKGFGGYEKAYVKTQDLPLSWKYWLTYLFEKLRKTKRRL